MAQLMALSISLQLDEETRTPVERIAAFAAAARPEQPSSQVRGLSKRNMLGRIGCAIAALLGPPCGLFAYPPWHSVILEAPQHGANLK